MDTNVSEEQEDAIFRFKVSRVRILTGCKESGKEKEGKFLYRQTRILSGKFL
jgi:hypothetical protein